MNEARSRATELLKGISARLVRVPRGAQLVLIGLAFAAGFVGIVLPLFKSGGAVSAELAGQLPSSAHISQQEHIGIAVDNVGDTIIAPVCVAASGPGVTLISVTFQGIDHVTAIGNRACGGRLTAQETISVVLELKFTQPGSIDLGLVPQQDALVIGPVLHGTVAVS